MYVKLMIAGKWAHLNAENLLLLNYTFEEMGSPTAVKNSYTQTIELSEENDIIFNSIYRSDRLQTEGGFNPLIRTPFRLFNDMDELLEMGYMKLDSIKRTAFTHSYVITLYGNLGNIIYGLSYNEDGTKKSLADLDYLTGGEDELNFKITASTIKEAWKELSSSARKAQGIWEVINFAPCYNGIPEKNFDANRILFKPADLGLPVNVDGYKTIGEESIITLPKKITEQEASDMRSWLQRPVISISSIFKGVENELAKKGISFDYSDIAKESNPYWRTWLTLPLLPNSKVTSAGGEESFGFYPNTQYVNSNPLSIQYSDKTIPAGSIVSGVLTCSMMFRAGQGVEYGAELSTNDSAYRNAISFVQAVMYAENVPVQYSEVKVVGSTGGIDIDSIAGQLGYSPLARTGYEQVGLDSTVWRQADSQSYRYNANIDFVFKGVSGGNTIKIFCDSYLYQVDSGGSVYEIMKGDTPYAFDSNGGVVEANLMSVENISTDFSYKVGGGVFSAADITKKMLLSTEYTPADYLLSYAKTFGLYFIIDKDFDTLKIVTRNTLFKDSIENISSKIDIREQTVNPYSVESKYYNFSFREGGGEFEKAYKRNYGREYGGRIVNTGYDFDADAKKVMEKVVFKNGVTALEQSLDFARYKTEDGKIYPAEVVRGGARYSLWNDKGESKEFDIPVPPVTPEWYGVEDGYDYQNAYKLQCHDAGNKAIDGSNVLLFYAGNQIHPYTHLTDDDNSMVLLNKGRACWNFNPSLALNAYPVFTRSFRWGQTENASLDFGVPSELDVPPTYVSASFDRSFDESFEGLNNPIPSVDYPEANTIYDRCWKKYIEDRYSVDSKIVRLKVNLNGRKVDEELLRKFYYFDGCYWQLNRVINYSLTTDGLTECEFVRVLDMDNYLNGQKY